MVLLGVENGTHLLWSKAQLYHMGCDLLLWALH